MERRSHARIILDMPYFVELHIDGQPLTSAMLVDISCGGIQAVFPPSRTSSAQLLGLSVNVLHLPFGNCPAVPGKVFWATKQRCGLRFTTALPMNALEVQTLARTL